MLLRTVDDHAATAAEVAVDAVGLRKSYGAAVALDGIDLRIDRGDVVAVLGPNGAGKTTLVEILEGYRAPTSGEVRVLGVDPAHGGPSWRDRIGVVLQESGAVPDLTVEETLEMYQAYYRRPRPLDALLDAGGLGSLRQARVRRLSGGQRRRLDLALALVGSPELLFLDEPTTGFDPEARHEAWDVVSAMAAEGTTIVLTTHYLDEAEHLANRIVLVVGGRIVADGDRETIAAEAGGQARIRFRHDAGADLSTCPVPVRVRRGWVEARTQTPTETMHQLTSWAIANRLDLRDLTLGRPSLEDLYLELVSK